MPFAAWIGFWHKADEGGAPTMSDFGGESDVMGPSTLRLLLTQSRLQVA
jgi:hypothetical protein